MGARNDDIPREVEPTMSRGIALNFLTKPRIRSAISVALRPVFAPGNRLIMRYIKLPQISSRPRRLVLLADFHAHHCRGSEEQLREVADRINAVERVDFVAMPGDFVSQDDPDAMNLVCNFLARIRWPIYATLGNHDHDHVIGAQAVTAALERAGVHVITDRAEIFDPEITLIGLDSYTHRSNLGTSQNQKTKDHALTAINEIDPLTPEGCKALGRAWSGHVIVLGHEPVLATYHRHFLHLAGHTHWGQIQIPAIAKRMYPLGSQPYPKGLYKDEGRFIYTTAGIGHHLPGRLGTPPEIAVIDF